MNFIVFVGIVAIVDAVHILRLFLNYVGLDYDSALGDGLEEICFVEVAATVEVEEFESFEKEGVDAHFGRGFEL